MKSDSGAVAFEAKLYAYRKGKDGFIVSFVVHPSEIPNELALADIGQRFAVGLGQLREESDKEAPEQSTGPKNEAASERAKQEYRMKPPALQAVVRASRLCQELRFQQWLERHCAAKGITTTEQAGEESTAELLRRCIGVKSRGEIASDPRACQRFLSVEGAYKEASGQMAEQRR